MFSCQGRSVSSRRWVPTPYLSGQDVSFVEQADVDEAHVLLVPQFEAAAITCRRLLLSPGAARDNANRIPEGWQLRPDLGARVVHSWPRNGDVLIPQLVGRLFQSGVVSFAVAATQRPLGILLFCLVGVSSAYAADAGPATPSMTVEHQPEIPPSAAPLTAIFCLLCTGSAPGFLLRALAVMGCRPGAYRQIPLEVGPG